MIKPLCKKCGERHWFNEGCKGVVVDKVVDTVKSVVDKPKPVKKVVVDKPRRKGRYLDGKKRKTYQAEWIAKKRARLK